MKRFLFFTLITFVIFSASNVTAQTDYGLVIGGIYVTPENAANITGEGITGTVSYDNATKTLLLNNAVITTKLQGIDNKDIKGLTIKLVGVNVIDATKAGITIHQSTTINGNGLIVIKSKEDCGIYLRNELNLIVAGGCKIEAIGQWGLSGINGKNNEWLTVDNSTLSVTGSKGSLLDLQILEMKGGCVITEPEGAVFNETSKRVEKNGEIVTSKVTISPNNTNINNVVKDNVLNIYISDNILHINTENYLNKNLKVYNTSGTIINNIVISSPETNVSLPQGLYIVCIDNICQKVIIK
ncbi:hypothetical protein HW49_03075 [Porphyromonadaceae bacterium COT-184 OH4590]|nr:hypothetical protein HW49_03075 [Porphyromonadaceae bacterium COT-184 OH4590]